MMDAASVERVGAVAAVLNSVAAELALLSTRAVRAAARADALPTPFPSPAPPRSARPAAHAATFAGRGPAQLRAPAVAGGSWDDVGPAPQWWPTAAASSGGHLLCLSDEGCHLVARPWSRPLGDFAVEEFLTPSSLLGGSVPPSPRNLFPRFIGFYTPTSHPLPPLFNLHRRWGCMCPI